MKTFPKCDLCLSEIIFPSCAVACVGPVSGGPSSRTSLLKEFVYNQSQRKDSMDEIVRGDQNFVKQKELISRSRGRESIRQISTKRNSMACIVIKRHKNKPSA